jgi:hypothetical protein
MSQRHSGWKREPGDTYNTPSWVVDALMPHIPKRLHLWEPSAGRGDMVRALVAAGHSVTATDIKDGVDFLQAGPRRGIDGIVSNPPFNLAQQFIEHGVKLMESAGGFVAMLLRVDYGTAATRQHLFGACPIFACKIELTRRIVWFEGTTGRPSFNHAWFIWDWRHRGEPTLRYGPVETKAINDNRASIWREPYVAMEVMS